MIPKHKATNKSNTKVSSFVCHRLLFIDFFIASTIDDAHTQIGQLQSKVGQLEAALTARDQELAAADARYRKSVEKTKEIIKTIDPKALAGTWLHNKLGSFITVPIKTFSLLQLKQFYRKSLPNMNMTHLDQWDR